MTEEEVKKFDAFMEEFRFYFVNICNGNDNLSRMNPIEAMYKIYETMFYTGAEPFSLNTEDITKLLNQTNDLQRDINSGKTTFEEQFQVLNEKIKNYKNKESADRIDELNKYLETAKGNLDSNRAQ